MRFSNRGRFLPRRALPYQRLASWEPRTGHARADETQKGGAPGAPCLTCLLSSSLLFRRCSFSALFCSPRPALLPPRIWWQ